MVNGFIIFYHGLTVTMVHSSYMTKVTMVYARYPLVIQHSHGKSQFLIGKPSINGPFSMAMLNNQRVISMFPHD